MYYLTELAGATFMLFTRTCDSTRKLALLLRNLGFDAIPIHGQMSQPKRLGALHKFKAGERSILVATGRCKGPPGRLPQRRSLPDVLAGCRRGQQRAGHPGGGRCGQRGRAPQLQGLHPPCGQDGARRTLRESPHARHPVSAPAPHRTRQPRLSACDPELMQPGRGCAGTRWSCSRRLRR